MKQIQILLNKLSKLTYIGESNNTLETKEGFTISLFTEFHSSKEGGIKFPSVQVILRVDYQGSFISNWGCSEEEETKLVVDFFLESKYQAEKFETKEEKRIINLGKDIFKNL